MNLACIQPVTPRLPHAPKRVINIDWRDILRFNSCRDVTFEEYSSTRISDNTPIPNLMGWDCVNEESQKKIRPFLSTPYPETCLSQSITDM